MSRKMGGLKMTVATMTMIPDTDPISSSPTLSTGADKETEFHLLYEKFSGKILAYIIRRVGIHHAEDISQDVWLKTWQTWDRWEDRGYTRAAFLYAAAHNLVVDRLRRGSYVTMISMDDPIYRGSQIKDSYVEGVSWRDALLDYRTMDWERRSDEEKDLSVFLRSYAARGKSYARRVRNLILYGMGVTQVELADMAGVSRVLIRADFFVLRRAYDIYSAGKDMEGEDPVPKKIRKKWHPSSSRSSQVSLLSEVTS